MSDEQNKIQEPVDNAKLDQAWDGAHEKQELRAAQLNERLLVTERQRHSATRAELRSEQNLHQDCIFERNRLQQELESLRLSLVSTSKNGGTTDLPITDERRHVVTAAFNAVRSGFAAAMGQQGYLNALEKAGLATQQAVPDPAAAEQALDDTQPRRSQLPRLPLSPVTRPLVPHFPTVLDSERAKQDEYERRYYPEKAKDPTSMTDFARGAVYSEGVGTAKVDYNEELVEETSKEWKIGTTNDPKSSIHSGETWCLRLHNGEDYFKCTFDDMRNWTLEQLVKGRSVAFHSLASTPDRFNMDVSRLASAAHLLCADPLPLTPEHADTSSIEYRVQHLREQVQHYLKEALQFGLDEVLDSPMTPCGDAVLSKALKIYKRDRRQAEIDLEPHDKLPSLPSNFEKDFLVDLLIFMVRGVPSPFLIRAVLRMRGYKLDGLPEQLWRTTVSAVHKLPDGSAFFTASYDLPLDHWLYTTNTGEPPQAPVGLEVLHKQIKEKFYVAARWAIAAATQNGKDMDFDPDALVRNLDLALFGVQASAHPTEPVKAGISNDEIASFLNEVLQDAQTYPEGDVPNKPQRTAQVMQGKCREVGVEFGAAEKKCWADNFHSYVVGRNPGFIQSKIIKVIEARRSKPKCVADQLDEQVRKYLSDVISQSLAVRSKSSRSGLDKAIEVLAQGMIAADRMVGPKFGEMAEQHLQAFVCEGTVTPELVEIAATILGYRPGQEDKVVDTDGVLRPGARRTLAKGEVEAEAEIYLDQLVSEARSQSTFRSKQVRYVVGRLWSDVGRLQLPQRHYAAFSEDLWHDVVARFNKGATLPLLMGVVRQILERQATEPTEATPMTEEQCLSACADWYKYMHRRMRHGWCKGRQGWQVGISSRELFQRATDKLLAAAHLGSPMLAADAANYVFIATEVRRKELQQEHRESRRDNEAPADPRKSLVADNRSEPVLHTQVGDELRAPNKLMGKLVQCHRCCIVVYNKNYTWRPWVESHKGNHCLPCFAKNFDGDVEWYWPRVYPVQTAEEQRKKLDQLNVAAGVEVFSGHTPSKD